MDIVQYVQENRSKFKDYEWLKQFDPDTDGYRFTPFKYMGMSLKFGLEEVVDGIAGDRWMRQNLTTDVTKRITLDHFRRGLTAAECNDLINYFAWNSFDFGIMRAEEGISELIPRRQYERVSMMRHFLRGPEFSKFIILKVGWQKYMRRFYLTRKELGSKLEHLGHTWAIAGCQLGGALLLELLGYIDPEDPLIVDKKRWTLLSWAVRSYALRGGDGFLLSSQNRYHMDKDPSVVDFLMNQMEPLDERKAKLWRQLEGAASLLGFLIHYDCRAGLGDTGPIIVEDGKPMIIRNIYINEPVFSWSEVAERRGLPYSIITAFVINPEKAGLQELRVNDVGTTFTRPADISAGVEQACIFLRWEPEGPESLPVSRLQKLDWDEVPDMVAKLKDGTIEWYAEVAKMPPRLKIWNGYQVYSWDPHTGSILRGLGLWDYANEMLDYWEMPPMASECYYVIRGIMPAQIPPGQVLISGGGHSDIPSRAPLTSRYRAYLKRVRDLGWYSDLSGTMPVPDDLKDNMDDDFLMKGMPEFDVPDDWMEQTVSPNR